MTGRHSGARRSTYTAVILAAVGGLLIGLGVWLTGPGGGGEDDARPTGEELPANAVSGPSATARCDPDEHLVPRCGAWWGAYIPYPEIDSGRTLKDAVYAFEKKIDRRLDLVYTYHDMSNSALDGQLLTPDEVELGRERLLMLAWESTVWTEPHHAGWKETQLGWKNIASGKYDEKIIDPQAERLKAYGKRVFFSFDQETDFRIDEGAGTPEEFVAAWRHIHDRFEELGVDNVVWVWTVSGYLGKKKEMKALYPGDDYVDWIGMDQYNYFLCHDTTNWIEFEDVQKPSYDWLRANVSDKKPIMLSEFATVPDPKDPDRSREWYEAIPDAVDAIPEARAYVHWNRPVPDNEYCDLTVNDGPELEGYRKAGQAEYFRQPVPTR
ncbi:glycoside hydrolase family 26 protein [Streptomyces sp. NPDC060194]|uniref:glycoside hydrolase family 26 protein n=1 Tax=Streptomyces sp. NPDC060194 TaxID=3347069 RepID=UPI0036499A55